MLRNFVYLKVFLAVVPDCNQSRSETDVQAFVQACAPIEKESSGIYPDERFR